MGELCLQDLSCAFAEVRGCGQTAEEFRLLGGRPVESAALFGRNQVLADTGAEAVPRKFGQQFGVVVRHREDGFASPTHDRQSIGVGVGVLPTCWHLAPHPSVEPERVFTGGPFPVAGNRLFQETIRDRSRPSASRRRWSGPTLEA